MEDKKLNITKEVINELKEKGIVIFDGDVYEFPEDTIRPMSRMNLYSPLAIMNEEPYVITEVGDKPLSKADRNAKVVGVRTEPKIGRNDPCTCGSGLKYKKCCGR